MSIDECLQAALTDARKLVEKGFWIRIHTYQASVILDYGVIHSDGELECSLVTKLYIVGEKNADHS